MKKSFKFWQILYRSLDRSKKRRHFFRAHPKICVSKYLSLFFSQKQPCTLSWHYYFFEIMKKKGNFYFQLLKKRLHLFFGPGFFLTSNILIIFYDIFYWINRAYFLPTKNCGCFILAKLPLGLNSDIWNLTVANIFDKNVDQTFSIFWPISIFYTNFDFLHQFRFFDLI